MNGTAVLRRGRDGPPRRLHPWVFGGSVASTDADPGAIVQVRDADGAFLAFGYYNPTSQIAVRLLSWDERQSIDDSFWRERLQRAIERRDASIIPPATTAVRLVNAESDGLPGLVVDRYGDWVVLQALTLGIDVRKRALAGMLARLTGARGVYERSDDDVRALEGLGPECGVLWGDEPPGVVEVVEAGLRFQVDVRHGHKTGFYLDQRENRRLVRRLASRRRLLNAFAYTGAFTVAAIAGGAADTMSVESSEAAVSAAIENLALNGFADRDAEDAFVAADVFGVLRQLRAEARTFDLIVLDPPKFAPSARHVAAAARGYKDINRIAFQLLSEGGLLATFSCSGPVSADLFRKIVAGAALDAGVDAQIVAVLSQAPDHLAALSFPEATYLKGLLCRVG